MEKFQAQTSIKLQWNENRGNEQSLMCYFGVPYPQYNSLLEHLAQRCYFQASQQCRKQFSVTAQTNLSPLAGLLFLDASGLLFTAL